MKRTRILAALAALAMVCALPAGATDYSLSPSTIIQGPYLLQDAATTGNGNTLDLKTALPSAVVYIDWSVGCSAGVVTIETVKPGAAASTFTWAPLATISWSAASKTDVVHIPYPIGVVRARISTTVVGGTVTVTGYGR